MSILLGSLVAQGVGVGTNILMNEINKKKEAELRRKQMLQQSQQIRSNRLIEDQNRFSGYEYGGNEFESFNFQAGGDIDGKMIPLDVQYQNRQLKKLNRFAKTNVDWYSGDRHKDKNRLYRWLSKPYYGLALQNAEAHGVSYKDLVARELRKYKSKKDAADQKYKDFRESKLDDYSNGGRLANGGLMNIGGGDSVSVNDKGTTEGFHETNDELILKGASGQESRLEPGEVVIDGNYALSKRNPRLGDSFSDRYMKLKLQSDKYKEQATLTADKIEGNRLRRLSDGFMSKAKLIPAEQEMYNSVNDKQGYAGMKTNEMQAGGPINNPSGDWKTITFNKSKWPDHVSARPSYPILPDDLYNGMYINGEYYESKNRFNDKLYIPLSEGKQNVTNNSNVSADGIIGQDDRKVKGGQKRYEYLQPSNPIGSEDIPKKQMDHTMEYAKNDYLSKHPNLLKGERLKQNREKRTINKSLKEDTKRLMNDPFFYNEWGFNYDLNETVEKADESLDRLATRDADKQLRQFKRQFNKDLRKNKNQDVDSTFNNTISNDINTKTKNSNATSKNSNATSNIKNDIALSAVDNIGNLALSLYDGFANKPDVPAAQLVSMPSRRRLNPYGRLGNISREIQSAISNEELNTSNSQVLRAAKQKLVSAGLNAKQQTMTDIIDRNIQMDNEYNNRAVAINSENTNRINEVNRFKYNQLAAKRDSMMANISANMANFGDDVMSSINNQRRRDLDLEIANITANSYPKEVVDYVYGNKKDKNRIFKSNKTRLYNSNWQTNALPRLYK